MAEQSPPVWGVPRSHAKRHLQTRYLLFLLSLVREKGAGRTWAATHALPALFTYIQELLLQESSLHCPSSSSRNPQWDGKGKSLDEGQDSLPAPSGQRAQPGPSPAGPYLPSQRRDHKHAEPSPQIRTYSATVFMGSRGSVLGLGDSEHMSSVAPKMAFPERCCPNQHHSGEDSLVWKDTCSRPGMPHKNALRSSLISV